MTNRLLYTLPVPSAAQQRVEPRARRNLATSGTLQSGPGTVEAISADPDEFLLQGQFRGEFSQAIALGLEELFGATDIEVVPYFGRDAARGTDGYYTLQDVNVPVAQPQDDRLQRFDGRIRKKGSRRSHWRAVKVAPESKTNPFGSASTELVGVPSIATNVQWWNQLDGTLESATVQSTTTGQHGDVDLYDASNASFSSNETYHLLYNAPYNQEWRTDPRVFDDYNRAKEQTFTTDPLTADSATVGDSLSSIERTAPNTWQRVYRVDHEFVGLPIIENGYRRLIPDSANEQLLAYEWNDTDEHYDIVQLGNTSWRLIDFDIRTIGTALIEAQGQWEDVNNRGTTYRLNLAIRRGYQDVHFWELENAGSSTPADLNTRLSPTAHDSDQIPGAPESGTIIERSRVNAQ